MKKYAVIVAGGSGARMGGGIPKQFRSLCGRPVLWWSIRAFNLENPDTDIIVVLPESFISLWNDFYSSLPERDRLPHRVASGGNTRTESVKNGLQLVSENDSLVAIHDGARPLVDTDLISRGWVEAGKHDAVVPAIPVSDSLRKLTGDGSVSVDRKDYVAVQTPQVFKTRLIKESYEKAGDRIFTDDAAVVENAGGKIYLIAGNVENIKITNPADMDIAAVIMDKKTDA